MRLEALNLFMQTEGAEQLAVGDAETTAAFGTMVAAGLAESMADERLLHGRWAQDLFRAVLISLDAITMIKDEDAGELHYDAARPLHLPDFRVVTKTGEKLLVEVKNVGPKGVWKTQKIRAEALAELREYARLTGGRLMFAHFWSGINWWTLVDADRLTPNGKYFELTFKAAGCADELGLLGDRMLMTTSTITVMMLAAGIKDGPALEPELAGGLSCLGFVPNTVHFACDGVPVTSRNEHELVKAVALYGGAEIVPCALVGDETGQTVGVVVFARAPGGAEHPSLGSRLSQIYSNRYIVATKDPIGGAVKQMRYRPDPTLTRLAKVAQAYGPGRTMPVQVFTQYPTEPANGQLTLW